MSFVMPVIESQPRNNVLGTVDSFTNNLKMLSIQKPQSGPSQATQIRWFVVIIRQKSADFWGMATRRG